MTQSMTTATGMIQGIPMDSFLIRALLAGAIVAMIAGPLGSFVIWRRLSFFGDTIAHASLSGVVMGILLGLSPTIGVFMAALLVALLLIVLQRQRPFSGDTPLAIISQGALALGVLSFSFVKNASFNLTDYLFGDILAVTSQDLWVLLAGSIIAFIFLAMIWKPLLSLTINEELAFVEGVSISKTQIKFMFLLAFIVALSLKIMGVLLVTALLIIPATIIRPFVRSPEQMALGASIIGVICITLGLCMSYFLDTPASPSIVVASLLFFLFSNLGGSLFKLKN